MSDPEKDLLIDRLIKYSDAQLDEACTKLATDWDQDNPRHFHFPNSADFIVRITIPDVVVDKPSRFAKEHCPKCGGTGWEPFTDPNGRNKVRRCECFVSRVKEIEAAKPAPQQLQESAEEPLLPGVESLSRQKRMR